MTEIFVFRNGATHMSLVGLCTHVNHRLYKGREAYQHALGVYYVV
jgi:hypothetical protein